MDCGRAGTRSEVDQCRNTDEGGSQGGGHAFASRTWIRQQFGLPLANAK